MSVCSATVDTLLSNLGRARESPYGGPTCRMNDIDSNSSFVTLPDIFIFNFAKDDVH